MKSLSMRWLAWPAIATAVALLAVWTSPTQVAQASPLNEMTAVGPGVNVGVGYTFEVDVDFTAADTPYQGYKGYLSWDNTIVDDASPPVYVYTGLGGMTLDSVPTEKPSGLQFGSGRVSGTVSDLGTAFTVELTCLAAGTSILHLVTPAEDPAFGNTHLGEGGVVIPTDLVDDSVTCEEQADLSLEKIAPPTAVAGGMIEYQLVVHNAGPSAAKGVIIGDDLPDDKVFVDAMVDLDGDTIPDFPCVPGWAASYPLDEDGDTLIDEDPVDTVDNDGDTLVDEDPPNLNIVQCVIDGPLTGLPPVAVSQTIIVTIIVEVPLASAGKLEINTAAVFASDAAGVPDPTVDPNPANDADYAVTQVLPADISISETTDKDVYSEGETIYYDITAHVNAGSPASDVVITKTVDCNQEITYCFALVSPPPPDMVFPCDCVVAPDLKSCTCTCTDGVTHLDPSADIGMAVDALVVGSEGNICENTAEVCWADPLCASVTSSVVCLPPTVRMEKDLDEDPVTIVDTTNLFLEMVDTDGDTVPDSLACLTIYELVSNAGNDPDGVGAYEFQLKFDHKIFDITIEDSSWLSNGGTRTVDCTMTIISENDIRWGCVSSGPVPGQLADGVAAIITVCPEADLVNRLTPGQENGLFEILLDENCQLADVMGDPLRIPIGTLAPGVLPGGLLEVCSDMAITVRILEADLNLDCVVDVLDEQAIAFRYGAFFGNLLYDPWYDLEPALKDFDIDIKDLQKVFGRDGSTCENPIPPQDPLPPPPW